MSSIFDIFLKEILLVFGLFVWLVQASRIYGKIDKIWQKNFIMITVLLHETIDMLDVKPDGIYVDATLGGAGQ